MVTRLAIRSAGFHRRKVRKTYADFKPLPHRPYDLDRISGRDQQC